ncbi:MAG TPA: ribonuclease HI, partial [Candidatus Mediterraneibacter excrementigallinarum]|nr:ribonuclease HI [Candidatus Mediterraneibacter excrementigallinarum]
EEKGTTFNRLTLIAAIRAMERLNQPCHLIFYSANLYVKGMIEQGNPEKWRRAEWKKAAGTAVQNKELWELFLDRAKGHEIEFRYSKYNDYKETLQAVMNGEEIET